MFDSVADEVLEQLFQAAPVGVDGSVRLDTEGTGGGVDDLPAAGYDFRQRQCTAVGSWFALPRQRQQVLDECLHALVSRFDVSQMVTRTLLAGELQLPWGDVERIAEVV